MRFPVTVLLVTLALGACSQYPSPVPPSPPATAPAPAQAPAATPPAATPATPAKPVEVGTCGDQSAVAKDARIANTPRWTTASEVDNFGYDVFRGEQEAGPFTKVTAQPLLGGGTTDETHKYEYRDDTIDPCKDYWYYVESITTKGEREKFTPVFKAPAKRRAADAAASH